MKVEKKDKDFEQLFISHFWIKTSSWSLKVHHAVQLLYSGNTKKTKHSQSNPFRREKTMLVHLYKMKLCMYRSDISWEYEEEEGQCGVLMGLLHQSRTHSHTLSPSHTPSLESKIPNLTLRRIYESSANGLSSAQHGQERAQYNSWHSILLAH